MTRQIGCIFFYFQAFNGSLVEKVSWEAETFFDAVNTILCGFDVNYLIQHYFLKSERCIYKETDEGEYAVPTKSGYNAIKVHFKIIP